MSILSFLLLQLPQIAHHIIVFFKICFYIILLLIENHYVSELMGLQQQADQIFFCNMDVIIKFLLHLEN